MFPKLARPRSAALAAAALLVALTLAGCGDGDDDASGSPGAGPGGEVIILTHSSFNVSDDVIREFEERYDATITIVQAGDAGEALNRAILTKDNPLADVFFGIDNTLFARPDASAIFEPYTSPNLDRVPPGLIFDASHRVTPVDYGYVNINYDKAALEAAGLAPPTTLEQLTEPAWRGRLVVENPATSSTGLAFLLTTVALFGEEGDLTWQDYWRGLRANDVLVVDGWEQAYFTSFSLYGGDRELVVSYATSPGYEWSQLEGAAEPPTGNLLPQGGVFRQIEAVGILAGARNPELARKLIDFMLEESFQRDVPGQMVVYPVVPGTALPEFFRFAEVPAAPASLEPATVAENQQRWVSEWTEIVLR